MLYQNFDNAISWRSNMIKNRGLLGGIVTFLAISIALFSEAIPGYSYVMVVLLSPLFLINLRKLKSHGVVFLIFSFILGPVYIGILHQYTPILYIFATLIFAASIRNRSIYIGQISILICSLLIVFVFVIQLVFLNQSDDRFSGLYGDPNFALYWFSLSIFFVISLCLKGATNKYNDILLPVFLLTLISVIAYLTQSRMAFVGVLLYIVGVYLIKTNRIYYLNLLFPVLMISSIFLQYIMFFVFTDFLSIGNTLNDNIFDRLTNFNDTSNLARTSAAFAGINSFIASDWFSILFGSADLFKATEAQAGHIPHNWFIQSLFVNGAALTIMIVYLTSVSYYMVESHSKLMMIVLIFYGSVLSAVSFLFMMLIVALLNSTTVSTRRSVNLKKLYPSKAFIV
jgi:hypothetical protein